MAKDFEIRYLDEAKPRPSTAVERTLAAIHNTWEGNNGRINQARAFVKRAKKSDARRRIEKATRKKNRRR
jgi:hypothetical protein